ncbi:MAG: NAD-dependent epimerase/dehydratase family protein [Deltaproteobacteria bacterium]|nr:NAD-dependent epimerase/dehydratase family protein [Deltaproteobacteria bacterium]
MSKTKPTACVTGGAGFIGSHLAEALLEKGYRVLVIDDLSAGNRQNVPAEAELHVLDIGSPEAATLVEIAGVDVLLHHAAQMNVRRSVEDPAFDAQVNILGTLRLLEGARKGGVGQVIFASTGGAIYGEQDEFPATESHPRRPVSPYGVSKLAGEAYLYYFHCAYGLDVTCLRYANVYGPRQSPHGEAGVVAIFLRKLLSGETPVINGDGLQTRDYVYVEDVVRTNLAALGRPGFHHFNVGTGIETTVVDLYDALAAAVDSPIRAEHGPGKEGEQRRSSIKADRGRRELGLSAPVSLEEGVARTAQWFRANS